MKYWIYQKWKTIPWKNHSIHFYPAYWLAVVVNNRIRNTEITSKISPALRPYGTPEIWNLTNICYNKQHRSNTVSNYTFFWSFMMRGRHWTFSFNQVYHRLRKLELFYIPPFWCYANYTTHTFTELYCKEKKSLLAISYQIRQNITNFLPIMEEHFSETIFLFNIHIQITTLNTWII